MCCVENEREKMKDIRSGSVVNGFDTPLSTVTLYSIDYVGRACAPVIIIM